MKRQINRRNLILGSGIAAATALSTSKAFSQQSTEKPKQEETKPQKTMPPPKTCEEAMQRLLAGNERFVSGKLHHPHTAMDWRKRLVGGQKPFATIIGCADSRVPPELLFDQGFGDLFVTASITCRPNWLW